jgi:hypothetical protein
MGCGVVRIVRCVDRRARHGRSQSTAALFATSTYQLAVLDVGTWHFAVAADAVDGATGRTVQSAQ